MTCDGDCTYDNLCLAEAAQATNCVGSCPVPDSNTTCTAEFAPVACGGTQWCLYPNLCTAVAAGQDEIDCIRDCPTNVNDTVACTSEFDPGTFRARKPVLTLCLYHVLLTLMFSACYSLLWRVCLPESVRGDGCLGHVCRLA